MPLDRVSPFPASIAPEHPRPTVQLRHEREDGTWHVDWMIASGDAADAALITFRLPRPLSDLMPRKHVEAERIQDHRATYLEYEGPLSAGRGRVRRLARGRVVAGQTEGDSITIQVAWERSDGPQDECRVYCLTPADGDRWRISRVA